MARRGFDKSALADAAGLRPGTVGVLARDGYDKQLDKIRRPEEDTITAIAKALGINEDDLRETAGYVRLAKREQTGDPSLQEIARQIKKLQEIERTPDPDAMVITAAGLGDLDAVQRAAVLNATSATAQAMMQSIRMAGNAIGTGITPAERRRAAHEREQVLNDLDTDSGNG